jgi:hypothetical protein
MCVSAFEMVVACSKNPTRVWGGGGQEKEREGGGGQKKERAVGGNEEAPSYIFPLLQTVTIVDIDITV